MRKVLCDARNTVNVQEMKSEDETKEEEKVVKIHSENFLRQGSPSLVQVPIESVFCAVNISIDR